MQSTLFFQIIGAIGSLGVLALGIGYLYSQFMKGKNGGDKEGLDQKNALTTYLTSQISGFKELVADQDKKISELGKEVASLRAVIGEKDKTIQKYLEILQNRNPELEKSMADITRSMKDINTFMHSINNHMKMHNKSTKVVTHTVEESQKTNAI